jgi:hypothetical protein
MTSGGPTCLHAVLPGEVVVADGPAVLEMCLEKAVGEILYDRGLRLAAASQVKIPPQGQGLQELTDEVAFQMLARLAQRGCNPKKLEIIALGPGCLLGGGLWAPDDVPVSLVPAKVALAYTPPETDRSQRVEFYVSSGRIVVEEMPPERAARKEKQTLIDGLALDALLGDARL